MAIIDRGDLCSGGSRATNQATLSVTTTAAVAAGELLVVFTTVDVAGTSSGIDMSTANLTIGSDSFRYSGDRRSNQPGTGSQIGVACTLWWMIAPRAYPFGTAITATFTSPTEADHSAIIARHYSLSAGNCVVVETNWTSNVTTTPAQPPSMNVSTASMAFERVRAIGAKWQPNVSVGYTKTDSWAFSWPLTLSGATVGSPDWEVSAWAESLGGTGVSAISAPTSSAVAPNQTSVYVVFREIPLVTGTLAAVEAADSARFTSSNFGDLGPWLAGGSTIDDQTSLSVATTTAAAAGELLIVVVAVDNIGGSTGDDLSVASVVDGIGNTYTKLGYTPNLVGPELRVTAAQSTAYTSIWYAINSAPMPAGISVIANFTNPLTSDASAMIGRRFSLGVPASVGIQRPGGPFADVLTGIRDCPVMSFGVGPGPIVTGRTWLSIRTVGVKTTARNDISLIPTTGWTAWANGNSRSVGVVSIPEIFVRAEHTFSDFYPTSAPTYISDVVQTAILIGLEITPVTATLAATETSGDGAGFSGINNNNLGWMEAYEGAVWLRADSTLYTADDNVTRVNTAGQITDTASFSGTVVTGILGTFAPTEGADTAAFAGKVGLIGTLATTEGADTSAFAGTVAWPVITGTLAATENTDTAAFAGFAQASGTLAAIEARDTAAFVGGPVVAGTLAATEGADTAAFAGAVVNINLGALAAIEGVDVAGFAGEVAWTGTLAAIEGADTAAFAVELGAVGGLHAIEAGDTFAGTGYLSLVDEKVGELIAHEDRVGGYSEPRADSTLVTADNTLFHASIDYFGQDRALFGGAITTNAQIAATEAADAAAFVGEVPIVGILAATEAMDTADFAGAAAFAVTGILAAQEARDTAQFSEAPIIITGVLAAQEASDTAYFAEPRWDQVGEGAGLENEVLRTVWLTGQGGRVTWLENEVEDTSWLQNLNPGVISLENEVLRITELRP